MKTTKLEKFRGGQIVKSGFRPFPVLKHQHWQTIWPSLIRKHPVVKTKRERIPLHDADFLDLDWLENSERPLIVVIHGLASSSNAKYIKGLQLALKKNKFASVALNLRGCSGVPNAKSQAYHGGISEDLNFLFKNLRRRFPKRPIGAVGFSLGANILLKSLAETGKKSELFAAVSVSAPLLLGPTTSRLRKGFSKLYEQYLLSFMKMQHHQKISHFRKHGPKSEWSKLKDLPSVWSIRNISEFDEYITAPLNGFNSADHYYRVCSTKPKLKQIQAPTLIIHAKDDPFIPEIVIPKKSQLSSSIMFELSEHGGHVGFLGVNKAGRPHYWIEERVPQFFSEILG